MNFEEIRELAPRIHQIAMKFGITKIYIFGSVARGEQNPQSDVDFLVEMQEGSSLFGAAGFGYETGQLLGLQVDVVPLPALLQSTDRHFLATIQQEAVVL